MMSSTAGRDIRFRRLCWARSLVLRPPPDASDSTPDSAPLLVVGPAVIGRPGLRRSAADPIADAVVVPPSQVFVRRFIAEGSEGSVGRLNGPIDAGDKGDKMKIRNGG